MRLIKAQDIADSLHVAIVVSRFNHDITEELLRGAVQRLQELEIHDDHVTIVWVPGAVEIPLAAQRLAKTNAYEVIITFGAVIKGETDHYEHVSQQVSSGCQQVMLTHNVPVIFGVLTTTDLAQAQDRVGGKKGHMGREAVDAAAEMVSVLRQITE